MVRRMMVGRMTCRDRQSSKTYSTEREMDMTINVTHQEGMDEILNRYEHLLQTSREKIVLDLKKTPATAVLAPYFEQGKMLRALLVFVAASAVGNEPRNMTMVAAAIELLHGASLIHDDIADEADERRGLPALHRQVGIGPAIVLGDYLILRSFAVLRESESAFESCNVLAALHMLNDYARACCMGEIRELLPSDQSDPEENYLAIVRGKTASQFAAATTLPVIVSGGDVHAIEAMRIYGLHLGIAFQIHDDLLDFIGDALVLRKPVGTSLAMGRSLLPLIYLERYGSRAGREAAQCLLRQIVRNGHADRVWLLADMVRLLREERILDRVTATRDTHVLLALQALDRLNHSNDVNALKTIAVFATSHQPALTLVGAAAQ
ncbi:MAG: octaprenyl diphosphate synthase [Nitrospira sp.]